MKSKRILHIFALLAIVSLLVVGGWVLLQKKLPLFQPINSFELVHALDHIPPTEVHKAVEPHLGKSFWEIDLYQLQADINALDWVRYTEVSRRWPDKLNISITEQKPVARWAETGLINGEGNVFFPSSILGYESLVRLNGSLEESKMVLNRFVTLQKELNSIDMLVQQLDYDNDVWTVAILNGPVLIIDSDGFLEKLNRFIRAYPRIDTPLRKSARAYDLRYSNGFIVRKPESLLK